MFTAHNQEDYTIIGENPTFATGSRDGNATCFFIHAIDDTTFEENEILNFTFVANSSRVELKNNLIKLSILDNEGM